MVLRPGVTSSRPGLMSITGRFSLAKVLSSATGFQPGSKSRWERTSRVVHCPGASLLSRYGSMPWSCALSCAQALFARPRRSLTVACAMARVLPSLSLPHYWITSSARARLHALELRPQLRPGFVRAAAEIIDCRVCHGPGPPIPESTALLDHLVGPSSAPCPGAAPSAAPRLCSRGRGDH